MWWYLLDVMLFQACFLGLYLLFKKETFYSHNRIYLLATALLSFVIPLLDFSIFNLSFGNATAEVDSISQFPDYYFMGDEVNVNASVESTTQETSTWSLDSILKFIYLIGISFFVIKFSVGYYKLKKLTRKARFERYIDKVKCYRLIASENAFTFWKSIFIGDQIPDSQREKITAHELEHAKAFHGLDLIISEILRLIFWVSPAHHWLKKELMLVHELQADKVAAKHLNKRDYAQSLLNQAFGTENLEFSHSFFNHSQLKQRLMMLQKKNSRPQHLLKYLLILPLLVLMLIYTSNSVEAQEKNQQTTEQTEIEKTDDKIGDVPFAVIESVPVFPGCENLGTNKERKECMSKEISQFVNKNFNTGLAKDLGLTGVNRVYVQFKIDKTGEVTDVAARAPHPDLKAEGERVINELPKMKPGEQKGEKVGVLYSLPITFQVSEINSDDKESQEPITEIKRVEENKVNRTGDVPFSVIEEVPIFPGCEGLSSNEERKECMSKKLSQFVNQNFDVNLAENLGLTGVNRVYVQFKIDKTGEIVNVAARAPHPDLEAEGIRVINKLPKMQPGKQKGENIGVLYSLPITFQISESYSEKKDDQEVITEIKRNEENKINKIGVVPFAVVENVPVFPGCESLSTNEEKRECMSDKVSKFVNKNFDKGLAKKLGLKGTTRVYVQFKIDDAGKIVNINTRAARPELEAEAKRVIKELPDMEPGQHEGKNVGVLYALPITF
ncbi:M56 family metallopeptidase [Psychroflexus sp. CAK8W]|uniref:M56 family metallopeptidase n=1 Tax=Psychroflexus longus TaxID=2873596 RepID=A0ABS7XL75_9FLAO|nr:M56 family metallopeptidase [Psychroflexus longus]MBZ9779744.1 M56 family metallopeptidase [Psychroflexus longus]